MEMAINLTMPEIVQYFGGEINGVNYDALSVLNIVLLKEHEERLNALEDKPTLEQVPIIPTVRII